MDPQTDKTVLNEQLKLLATAVNTAATSCFTVGIATPLAGYIYNVSGFQGSLSILTLGLGIVGWLAAATLLHLSAQGIIRRLKP